MPSIPTLQNLCIIAIREKGSAELQSYLNDLLNNKFEGSSLTKERASQDDGSETGRLAENEDSFTIKRQKNLKEFLSIAIEDAKTRHECESQDNQRNESLKIKNIELHLKIRKLECEMDCMRVNNERLIEEIARHDLAFKKKFQEELELRDIKDKEFAEKEHRLSCCLETLRQLISALHLLKIEKKNLETENEKLKNLFLDLNEELMESEENVNTNSLSENLADCKDIKSLNAKLMALMNSVQLGEMKFSKLENDKIKLEEKCQQLEEHLKLFQQKSDTDSCVSKKCAKLRKDMQILESDSDHIHELYKALLDNKKLMTLEIVNLEEECEKLKCENKKLSVYVINMQSQVAQSQQQIGSFVQCITELSGRCIIEKEDMDQLEIHNSELMKQVQVLEAFKQVFDNLEIVSPRENNSSDLENQIVRANKISNKITNIQQNLKTVTDENVKVKKQIETLKILDGEFKELKEQFQQLKNVMNLMVAENENSETINESKLQEQISTQYNDIIKLNIELQNLLRQYSKLQEGYNKLICEYKDVNSKKKKYKHNCKVLQKFARIVRSDFKVWEQEKKNLVQQVIKYKEKCQRKTEQLNVVQKTHSFRN